MSFYEIFDLATEAPLSMRYYLDLTPKKKTESRMHEFLFYPLVFVGLWSATSCPGDIGAKQPRIRSLRQLSFGHETAYLNKLT